MVQEDARCYCSNEIAWATTFHPDFTPRLRRACAEDQVPCVSSCFSQPHTTPRFPAVLAIHQLPCPPTDNYPKGPIFHANMEQLLGDGVFNVDGELWEMQRKTASHMFSKRKFSESMLPVFMQHVAQAQAQLQAAASSGQPIDMQRLFFAYTLDSIGRIAFGEDIGSLREASPFAAAFDTAQQLVEKRFFNPAWQIMEVLTGRAGQIKSAVATLDKFCYDLIAARRKSAAGPADDVLSWFMAYQNSDGDSLSDKQLRDIVLSFIIAGRDTTAQNLSWTLYLLTQHPQCMAAVREEAQRVLPADVNSISLEHTDQLVYTLACVKEGLRLFPSVPKDAKHALHDDVLPDGTHVPAGTWLCYLPHAMGRSAQIWPEPDAYMPQRFLDEPWPSPFKYPVFNAGRRTCLGQRMAVLESSTLLALLVRDFDFHVAPQAPAITPEDSLTLPMRHGLLMRVQSAR